MEQLQEKLQIRRYREPYRKSSGIVITKDNPYIVFPHFRVSKSRKRTNSYQYSQFIGHYDHVHHKFIVEKHIIHSR
jgi:hypothetical protein